MMNLKPEELIREAMRANPEEGIKELRKSSESSMKWFQPWKKED